MLNEDGIVTGQMLPSNRNILHVNPENQNLVLPLPSTVIRHDSGKDEHLLKASTERASLNLKETSLIATYL